MGMTVPLTVNLLADTDEIFSLLTWLREDSAVSPHVKTHSSSGLRRGELGSPINQIVVSLSASGTLAAFSACLKAWFKTRKSDVQVTITHETTSISLNATNISNVTAWLENLTRK
ncbi:effector-associated constant component EACC1 [Jatrophihabitans sp.]|uniref:effector-associated constant component EACC1 n=1 Tax=Jatrophihabitans sp. TaxID=1932789 RepID=UPI0038CDBD87